MAQPNPLRWLARGIRYAMWRSANQQAARRTPPDYLYFLLEGALPEFGPIRTEWWQRFLPNQAPSLQSLGEQFNRIALDPRIKGVVIHLRPLMMPLAHLQTLRDLITKVRASGKRVIVWVPSLDTATLYVATTADEILLQPGGSVNPLGISRDYMFFKEPLEKLGVEIETVRISPYKSAPEQFTQTGFSPEARQMATWLVDDTYDEMVRAIAAGRNLSEEQAKALIDNAPYTDEQALTARVVDDLLSEEELPRYLAKKDEVPPTEGEEIPSVTLSTWHQASKTVLLAPLMDTEKYIALIRVEGLIMSGRTRRMPLRLPIPLPIAGDDQSGDLTVIQLARAAAEDERAVAVVLFVESSGGSSLASETMAAALDKLAEKKPIVAVFGAVAASGGYYVATPAQWMIAQPGTVTGSIGVFTLKGVVTELLDKLRVGREKISRGKNVTIYDGDKKLTAAEEAIIQTGIQRTYDLFLERVGKARKMTRDAVHAVADGRVWTGRQALENGLVDELGNWRTGWRKACELAGVPLNTPLAEILPPREFLPPK
jgi:protease-4